MHRLRILLIVVLVNIAYFPRMLLADETIFNFTEKKNNNSHIRTILYFEGLVAANAYIASQSPDSYGKVAYIVSPFVISSSTSKEVNIVSFLGFLAIGHYNINKIDQNTMSESEIFKRNMVAWNILGALVATTYYVTGKKPDNNKFSLNIIPIRGNGALLTFSYRF